MFYYVCHRCYSENMKQLKYINQSKIHKTLHHLPFQIGKRNIQSIRLQLLQMFTSTLVIASNCVWEKRGLQQLIAKWKQVSEPMHCVLCVTLSLWIDSLFYEGHPRHIFFKRLLNQLKTTLQVRSTTKWWLLNFELLYKMFFFFKKKATTYSLNSAGLFFLARLEQKRTHFAIIESSTITIIRLYLANYNLLDNCKLV